MGAFGDAIARNRRAQPNAAAAPSASPAPTPDVDPHAELRRRRDALAAQVTELHWDLGGLAYEMAIRDHFRLDVLVRRAAVLQERDAELAELERLMRMERDGMAGSCPHCGAPHSRGALFCWQCGTTLMERLSNGSATGEEGSTEIMDALLSGHTHEPLSPAQE
ncbi:MAG TPA: zinc ribbon domain-containing protein [Solirubrobacteraceae bacterium]